MSFARRENLRILLLNQRDLKHPKAGGAEVFTEEIASRWAKWGHEVTLFTAHFPGGLPEEVVNGVHIIRRGGELTLYLQAFLYYRREAKDQFDLIIDEINAIPFFTPLYTRFDRRAKSVFLVHHIFRKVWFYETRFPVNIVGYFMEPLSLLLYRRHIGMTVSRSTQLELMRLGHDEKNIAIMPEGINFTPIENLDWSRKASVPTFLYVGRLINNKRVHHVIEAFAYLRKTCPTAQLQIVGKGGPEYIQYLHDLCNRFGISDSVEFCGFVSQEVKLDLMSRAHALLVSSVAEGWGLVVTEANAMGTPAIVYNVKGLRDSVRNDVTGMVVDNIKPKGLAAAMQRFLEEPALQHRLTQAAWEWSHEFSWDKAAAFTETLLLQRLEKVSAQTENEALIFNLTVADLSSSVNRQQFTS